MLSARHRVDRSAFDVLWKEGSVVHSPYVVLRIKENGEASRFSVVVSKKNAKTSVSRHRLRRRVYAALGELFPELRGTYHGIVILKPAAKELTAFKSLTAALREVLQKAGALT